MADDLKRYLYKQLPRKDTWVTFIQNVVTINGDKCPYIVSVEGLHAIVVSDRDGVPVIKVANDNAPEHALRPGFLSTFALATDQGSKLGLSKNKSIICYYNTYQNCTNLVCAVKCANGCHLVEQHLYSAILHCDLRWDPHSDSVRNSNQIVSHVSKTNGLISTKPVTQVVQFNRLPLVVSFIANSNANTGLIVSLEKELAPLFEELRQAVEVS